MMRLGMPIPRPTARAIRSDFPSDSVFNEGLLLDPLEAVGDAAGPTIFDEDRGRELVETMFPDTSVAVVSAAAAEFAVAQYPLYILTALATSLLMFPALEPVHLLLTHAVRYEEAEEAKSSRQ
jgi:hypothetical protein